MRQLILVTVILLALSCAAPCCECIGVERPCQNLRAEAAFVGRVLETAPVRHPVDENSYTFGYSMRFAVDETLRGDLGTEIVIETGNGGGDCGTPLAPGGRYLIFAYREKDGSLWTGLCSGNQAITNDIADQELLKDFRRLVKKQTGSIFGHVSFSEPFWREDEVRDGDSSPVGGLTIVARSSNSSVVTQTSKDGSYQFDSLLPGQYTVVPEIDSTADLDHEYEDRYQADISAGVCANVNLDLRPSTRIRGHVSRPPGVKTEFVEVVALPIHVKDLNHYSGKWDLAGDDGRFDLWPLPPGDYYVGVNINGSPSAEAPFPPTYYPGVTSKAAAGIVHVSKGETKELELPLPEVAATRTVHFVAIGLEGKPLRSVYVQLEDLRHPGDASSHVNVDLDAKGAGKLMVYAGYSYHLHASHYVSIRNDWCAEPVTIKAGTDPIEARFVMDRKSDNCFITEIDTGKK